MKQKLKCVWPKVGKGQWELTETPFAVSIEKVFPPHFNTPVNNANARFIAASKRMAEQVVKDWEEAQKSVLYWVNEYSDLTGIAAEMPALEAKEKELRELLESAGFSFIEETETP